MLKIKFITLFVGLQYMVTGQDYCEVLFDSIQPKTEFTSLSNKELIELCANHIGDFNQPLLTYGSDDPGDWLSVGKGVTKFSEDMMPEGRWIDLNGDEQLDLVISFLAGYEYTFTAFYLANERGFSFVYSGIGVFFGKLSNENLVYVHPACCNDPSHEFYEIELDEKTGQWQVKDSFSVTNAYSSGFPSREDLNSEEIYSNPDEEVNAIGASASRVATFPVGTEFRVIKKIEGDGHILHFVEVHWDGSVMLLPKAFCWVELPQ